MKSAHFLCLLIGFWACSGAFAKVISCSDENGRKIFTDNKSLCASSSDQTELNLKHSQDTRVNFRYPERSYTQVKSDKYEIYLETTSDPENQRLQNKAVKKLINGLDFVFSKLPDHSHEKLKEIDYYLMLGKRSPLGGETNGLRYVGEGGVKRYSLYDKRWNNSVIIYSLDNFLYHGKLWTHQPLCHELAHAWHLLNWRSKYKPIYDTWMSSRQSSLYLNVEDYKGRQISPAYAYTNQLEYFADLSAMYFVGGSYYPFDKAGLKSYDPSGYDMIEALWGLK